MELTLYWRLLAPTGAYGSVFVHLLDPAGQILAQHDGQPVLNSYPIPAWQPGMIIADERSLTVPAGASLEGASLAIGLYDPATLERWPAVSADGSPLADNRLLLPLEVGE
jgi:hypothetical protein